MGFGGSKWSIRGTESPFRVLEWDFRVGAAGCCQVKGGFGGAAPWGMTRSPGFRMSARWGMVRSPTFRLSVRTVVPVCGLLLRAQLAGLSAIASRGVLERLGGQRFGRRRLGGLGVARLRFGRLRLGTGSGVGAGGLAFAFVAGEPAEDPGALLRPELEAGVVAED